jgi:preprotein translocase subunit SecF
LKERIIPFLKYRYWAYVFSLSLLVIFVVITIFKGGLQFGVDFVGGLKMIAKFEKGVHEEQIRDVLRAYSPTVQQVGEAGVNSYIISTKLQQASAYLAKEKTLDALEKKYPGVGTASEDMILASIGKGVNTGALQAVLAEKDALMQKINEGQKNEYLIYQKENPEKKTRYNSDEIESLLKGNYKNIDVLSGVAFMVAFNKPIDEAALRSLAGEYGMNEMRSRYLEKPTYIFSKVSFDEADRIRAELNKNFKNVEVLSVENVGPAVGSYLRQSALKLIIVSIVLMTIYLAYRFELRYAVGAMVALVHDIMLSVAFCGVAGIEINIPVIAALLTIFGYSVNDTIVIFDRIRESTHIETKLSFIDVMDKAITQTLSRTTLTVLLTLYSVVALYMIGGEGITDFALVLVFGFMIGAYSSIYQASPVVLWWEKFIHRLRAR